MPSCRDEGASQQLREVEPDHLGAERRAGDRPDREAGGGGHHTANDHSCRLATSGLRERASWRDADSTQRCASGNGPKPASALMWPASPRLTVAAPQRAAQARALEAVIQGSESLVTTTLRIGRRLPAFSDLALLRFVFLPLLFFAALLFLLVFRWSRQLILPVVGGVGARWLVQVPGSLYVWALPVPES